MGELVIAVFEGQGTAKKVLAKLKKRSVQGIVDLEGAVVAERDELGRTKVSNLGNIALDHTAGGSAFGLIMGAILGGIFGAGPIGAGFGAAVGASTGVITGLFDQSDDEEVVLRAIARDMLPGTSALGVVLFVAERDREMLLTDLKDVQGKVVRSSLSVKNEIELKEMLKREYRSG